MSKKRMLALVLAAVLSLSSTSVALADGESTAPETETTTTSEPADETSTDAPAEPQQPVEEENKTPESEEPATEEKDPEEQAPADDNGAVTGAGDASAISAATNAVTLDEPAELAANGVTDAASLAAALEAGGTVTLGSNITIDSKQDIEITKNTVLDLAGFTITETYGAMNHYIFVINGGSLTIKDSAGSGAIKATDPSYGYGIQLRSNSTLNIESGSIETTQETIDIYTTASNVTVSISGGRVESTADSVMNVRGNGNTNVEITGGELVSDGRTGIYISSYTPDAITFNMSGGSLTHSSGRSGAIQAYKGANITISGDAAITSEDSAAIQAQEDVDVTVNGGTLSGNGYGMQVEDNATVTINNGSISGKTGIDAEKNTTITINGGEIIGTKDDVKSDGTGNVAVNGGVFSDDLTSNSGVKVSETAAQVKHESSGETRYRYGDSATKFDVEANDQITITKNPEGSGFQFTGSEGDTVEVTNRSGDDVEVNGHTLKNGMTDDSVAVIEEKPVTPPTPSNPSNRSDNDDGGDYFGNETWDEVKDQIAEAEEGDTIKVSATGLPYFPSSVARALKGKDITLEVRKNGVTYEVNGLEIGDIDKIWYEFDELETELLTADADSETSSEADTEAKPIPDTGR